MAETYNGILFNLSEEMDDYEYLMQVLEYILPVSYAGFVYLPLFPDSEDENTQGWDYKIFFDIERFRQVIRRT